MIYIGLWLLTGLCGDLYWILRYWKYLTKEDIPDILHWSALVSIALGPFSFIASKPL